MSPPRTARRRAVPRHDIWRTQVRRATKEVMAGLPSGGAAATGDVHRAPVTTGVIYGTGMSAGRPGPETGLREYRQAMTTSSIDLKQYIRGIPDFPKPGILFYDISTLMRNADAWQIAMGRLTAAVAPWSVDMLAAIESRGFLTAAPLASRLGCGLVMLRKPGKLPGQTISYDYDLEYGTDSLHIQADAIVPGQRVVVMDDLLATGGTLAASIALLRKVGAEVVGAATLIELRSLGGRDRLDVPVKTLVAYDD
ncbi:adenine phosphoribosyltransferase [Novacetimonas hansenii ATCC 23769]|uniref:Adenine phosphoribosyltransferase n=3 Tax=Novacetimonas hansenii TaxID=436 RepID=D5QAZ6_NOVHA|nr:adenine phosphoribosyltransferase [Novacetimonas hansenii ATCC 23769]